MIISKLREKYMHSASEMQGNSNAVFRVFTLELVVRVDIAVTFA